MFMFIYMWTLVRLICKIIKLTLVWFIGCDFKKRDSFITLCANKSAIIF